MEQKELKKLIGQYLAQGLTLSDIQKKLGDDHDAKMTFLDLRLIASELEEVDWSKFNPAETKKDEAPATQASNDTDGEDAVSDGEWESPDSPSSGKTSVELSPIARPGAILSGKVKFGSGASAEWMLDQMGRLALDKKSGSPTQQDIQEFQMELQKALAKMGY